MIHPSATSIGARDRESGKARVGFAICDPGLSFGAIVGVGAKESPHGVGADLSFVSVFTLKQQADGAVLAEERPLRPAPAATGDRHWTSPRMCRHGSKADPSSVSSA